MKTIEVLKDRTDAELVLLDQNPGVAILDIKTECSGIAGEYRHDVTAEIDEEYFRRLDELIAGLTLFEQSQTGTVH